MKSSDLFALSVKNLWRRKLRTSLTVFGVVIGTTAIILMVSLGIAVNQNYTEEISRLGNLNNINVYQQYNYGPNGENNSKKITDAVIAEFERIPGVDVATAVANVNLKMTAGKYTSYMYISGMRAEMYEILNIKMAQGKLLEEEDSMSIMFGSYTPYNFYDPKSRGKNTGGRMFFMGGMGGMGGMEQPEPSVNLMDEKLLISYDMSFGERKQPNQTVTTKPPKPITVYAAGMIADDAGEYAYNNYMLFEDVVKLAAEKQKYDESLNPNNRNNNKGKTQDQGYQNALVHVEDMKNVKEVLQQVKDMGFEAHSLTEYLDSMQKTAANLQGILGGIGAVSLLVAAIGITNTMVMSIHERTKEIGVMKVIGASLQDIKRMFLTEAALIGFMGGVVGLMISFTGSYILNKLGSSGMNFLGFYMSEGSKMSVIPLWLYFAATGFTTLVGLVSGYFPARRGMKLSVLQALRTE